MLKKKAIIVAIMSLVLLASILINFIKVDEKIDNRVNSRVNFFGLPKKSNNKIGSVIQITVKDKNGNIKYKTEFPMHSPTKTWGEIIKNVLSCSYCNDCDVHVIGSCSKSDYLNKLGSEKILRITEAEEYYHEYDWDAVDGYHTNIVVGNGTSPVFNRTAWNLKSPIALLEPSAHYTYDDNYIYITLSSVFQPETSVEVTELGIALIFDKFGGYNERCYTLIFYDPLPNPIVVNVNDTMTITYRFLIP